MAKKPGQSEQQPTSTAGKGEGEKAQKPPRSLLGRAVQWGLSGVGLVFLLAVLAWFMAAPRGELRLALAAAVEATPQDASAARDAFQLANTHLTEAQQYHAILSFRDHDPNKPLVRMPRPERPNTTTLSDIIQEFRANASIEGEGSSVTISVRVVRLLETLYELVGWYDYFIYVTSVDNVDCESGQGPQCYSMVLSLSPFGDVLPLKGTLDEIANDLSVYIFRSVTLHENNLWQAQPETNGLPTPYLFAVSIPPRMAAFAKAALGIDMLVRGTGHPDCVALTRERCVDRARDLLDESIDPKKGGVSENPAAALGLSLIATEEGFRAARELSPETVVQQSFEEAKRWMQVARRSSFVRDETAKDDFVERFNGLILGKLKLDQDFYRNTASFVCALETNRRARWRECLKLIAAITAYPEPLAPYVEATKFYAELQNAVDDAGRASALADIYQRLDELKADDVPLSDEEKKLRTWSLHRILVLDGCVHPDEASIATLKSVAEAYIRKAPGAEALKIAKADVAGCAFGTTLVQPGTIESLEQELPTLPEDGRYRLAFSLAKYYVRERDFEHALKLLKLAVALPYVGAYVTAAPEFDEFMRDSRYGGEFLQVHLANPGEQNC